MKGMPRFPTGSALPHMTSTFLASLPQRLPHGRLPTTIVSPPARPKDRPRPGRGREATRARDSGPVLSRLAGAGPRRQRAEPTLQPRAALPALCQSTIAVFAGVLRVACRAYKCLSVPCRAYLLLSDFGRRSAEKGAAGGLGDVDPGRDCARRRRTRRTACEYAGRPSPFSRLAPPENQRSSETVNVQVQSTVLLDR